MVCGNTLHFYPYLSFKGITNLILAAVLNRIAKEGNKDMEVVELPNKAAFQELEAIEEQEKVKQQQHT